MKKNILMFVAGALSMFVICVSAAILYKAEDVSYSPKDSSWEADNVQNAITALKDDFEENSIKGKIDIAILPVGVLEYETSIDNIGMIIAEEIDTGIYNHWVTLYRKGEISINGTACYTTTSTPLYKNTISISNNKINLLSSAHILTRKHRIIVISDDYLTEIENKSAF